jgi:hypothetical protein
VGLNNNNNNNNKENGPFSGLLPIQEKTKEGKAASASCIQ